MRKFFKFILIFVIIAALACVGIFGYGLFMRVSYPMGYSEYVTRYAAENNLPPSLVFAVIKCESSFNPNVVSSVGAKGLMQITPDTFTWLQTKTGEQIDDVDLFGPAINIRYGTMLLSYDLKNLSAGGDLNDPANIRKAVAAYHAGLTKVKSWLVNGQLGDIPYADTAQYVQRVLEVQKIYQQLYKIQ